MVNLGASSAAFLDYLDRWHSDLKELSLDELVDHKPESVAIACVDVIVGFCDEGALASPRIRVLVEPITHLFMALHQRGVQHFILPQDTHEPDAVEFAAYPPHCIEGTHEAETVAEFKALPFSDQFTIIPKNALSAFVDTALPSWVRDHPGVTTYIVVGDCSDLCTYNLALELRMDANAKQLARRVIVVETCVDTFDIPVEVAQQQGLRPHPGDLHHVLFLHHLEQNGVEIVKRLT